MLHDRKKNTMAGAIYRVVSLIQGEDGQNEPELLTDVELVERFAPGIDTTKASQAKLVDEWVRGFAGSTAIQAGFGVKVEKVDSRQVFEQRLENYLGLEEAAREAKKDLVGALRSVLSDITAEDIAEGAVHATTPKSKVKVGIVEYFIAKSKVPAKEVLTKYGDGFSSEVVDELQGIQDKRAAEARKRLGKG